MAACPRQERSELLKGPSVTSVSNLRSTFSYDESEGDVKFGSLWPYQKIVITLVALRPGLDVLRTVGGTLTGTDLIGLAIVGVCVPKFMLRRFAYPRAAPFTFMLLYAVLAIAYGVIGLLWAGTNDYYTEAFRLLVILCSACVMYQVALINPKIPIKALALSTVVPFLVAVYQLATGHGLSKSIYAPGEENVIRAFGTFDHSNTLAIFAVLIGSLAIGLLFTKIGTKTQRRWWLVLAGACAVITFATYCRSAWIALPVALIVVGVRGRRPGTAFLFISAAVIGALVVASKDIATRVSGVSSVNWREELWAGLFHHMTIQYYPFGIGLGQIDNLVQQTTIQLGIYQVIQAHNDYIRVFIETGLVGFFLYFGALLLIVQMSWDALRKSTTDAYSRALCLGSLGATIGLFIVSISDNIFQETVLMVIYWGLVGATIGALDRNAGVVGQIPTDAAIDRHSSVRR